MHISQEIITIRGNDKNLTATAYVFKDVKPGRWRLYYLNNRPVDYDQRTYSSEDTNVTDLGMETIEINGQGGVYSLVITGPGNVKNEGLPMRPHSYHVYTVAQDNKVSILWQIPQFVIITIAEVLFSVTCLEFAYSQSAPSMKTVVQAAWLLTTSVGNAIIVVIAFIDPFDDAAIEFFVYSAAMFLVIAILALMSHFYYDYHYFTKGEEDTVMNQEKILILESPLH